MAGYFTAGLNAGRLEAGCKSINTRSNGDATEVYREAGSESKLQACGFRHAAHVPGRIENYFNIHRLYRRQF